MASSEKTLRLDDPQNRQGIPANINHLVRSQGFGRFEYLLPDEYRLDVQLKDMAAAEKKSILKQADTYRKDVNRL